MPTTTTELIVPESRPEAVNGVVEAVLSERLPEDTVAGKLNKTKAGIVKCWSLTFAVQIKLAPAEPEEVPAICTVRLGSPPVQVTS